MFDFKIACFCFLQSDVCEFVLQLTNASAEIIYCRVLLLNGLNFRKLIYIEDPEYVEAMRGGFGTVKLSPTENAHFEVDIPYDLLPVHIGMFFVYFVKALLIAT